MNMNMEQIVLDMDLERQAKKAWVDGLEGTMPLTTLDYTAPQNYVMRAWGFRFSSDVQDRGRAVVYLKDRLHETFRHLPYLGGQFIHASEGELPRLVYPSNNQLSNLDMFPNEVFSSQDLDGSMFYWTFDEILELGIPASCMDKHLLWLLPTRDPEPGDACHPVTLRVSFFKGGLILGFAFHRAIMDGVATTDFMNYFAGALSPPGHALALRKVGFCQYTEAAAKSTRIVPWGLGGYDFTIPPSPPVLPTAVAKVFRIESASASALHELVQLVQRDPPTPDRRDHQATITDTLCALVWLHITRARLFAGRIQPSDTTCLSTAVNIRSRLPDGTLGATTEGYIGNMWLRALARSTVEDLVGGPNIASSLDLHPTASLVARAASLIREAVYLLEQHGALQRHVAVAALAADPCNGNGNEAWRAVTPPDVDAAVRRVISRHTTGVDISVGVALGGDVEFDIPGVVGGKGKAAWVRRAYTPNAGAVAFLPRVGGTKGDADWEVWIALPEEEMNILESRNELGEWLNGPPA
jgi:hypothetical protein